MVAPLDIQAVAGSREPREPNAEAVFSPAWVFRVFPKDAALILRALGGRLKDDADRQAASDLCDRLTLQRAAAVRDFASPYEAAAEHVRAKGTPRRQRPARAPPRSMTRVRSTRPRARQPMRHTDARTPRNWCCTD
jgi:hypothetical protein